MSDQSATYCPVTSLPSGMGSIESPRCAWSGNSWPKTSIAKDTGLLVAPFAPGNLTVGHNVNSRVEVDAVMAKAAKAGATVLKPQQDTFYGGYAVYFLDLDNHVWEVVYNPGFQ